MLYQDSEVEEEVGSEAEEDEEDIRDSATTKF